MTKFRGVLRVLGWGLGMILVATFLIGFAAPYLSPARFWWTDLFALLLPLVSPVVGAIALGLGGYGLWRRQWGRIVLAAALLGLIAVRFGPRMEAWTTSASEIESLRLMSFNIPQVSNPEDASVAAVAQIVRRVAPDVLAVQESFVHTSARSSSELQQASPTLRPLLGFLGYAPPRRLPSEMVIQQPVLGRIPLDSMKVHPLPPSGDSDARSRFTRTLFSWHGRPVVLYNLHLHTVGATNPWERLVRRGFSVSAWRSFLRVYREGALRRAQQARLIRRMIEKEGLPVLVAGDFNSTRHQWAYQHIAQGLQNPLTQRGLGWKKTFPSQFPLVRIDHVLASPEWTVTRARVPTLQESQNASDHRPVVVQLQWTERQD